MEGPKWGGSRGGVPLLLEPESAGWGERPDSDAPRIWYRDPPSLNGEVTVESITARSSKRVWWRCANGHEWAAPAYSRATTWSTRPEFRKTLRRRGAKG